MDSLRATDPLAANWVVIVLLFAFGAMGWVNLASPRKWALLRRSFLTDRLGRQSLRDELDIQDRTLVGLVVVACALCALFACQVAVLYGGATGGSALWARFFGIGLGSVLLQVLLVRLTGTIFQGDSGLTEHLYTLLVFYIVTGLLLLPITSMLAFPHQLAWRGWLVVLGLGTLALTTLFRWVRAALVGLGEGVPVRYIFIYLCALEILPIAVLLQQLRSTATITFLTP